MPFYFLFGFRSGEFHGALIQYRSYNAKNKKKIKKSVGKNKTDNNRVRGSQYIDGYRILIINEI